MTQGEFDNDGVAQFGVNDNDEDKFDNTFKVATPIGGVLAWVKNLTGVPDLTTNYVECNGQVLSDADSPLNGETIPDLNGSNYFLRGASTSGGTGGTATHTHSVGGGSNPGGAPGGGGALNASTTASSSIPPYQNMVYIMRVK